MRDEPLFLSEGGEGVVDVQLPSGRQLQRAVVGRAAWDVDVVLVVGPLALRLAVLRSPRIVGASSLLESCLVSWKRSKNTPFAPGGRGIISARIYSGDLNKMD